MKCQLILLVAICLASVFALPVPDEEVSAVQGAPVAEAKADVAAKKPEDKPLEAAASVVAKSVESRAVEEKPATEAILPVTAESPKPIEPKSDVKSDAKKTETKTDLKLDAPDAETAPAIPTEKKVQPINVEAPLPAAAAAAAADKSTEAAAVNAAEDKKPESKASARAEEPIEAPKAVPLVEAPAANVEVQKQIVDEQKPAVHTSPLALGKSNEPSKEANADNQETKAVKEEATQDAAAPTKKSAVEEFKEPQTTERAIELKSEAKPAAAVETPIIPLEPVPEISDVSPIALASTEEKKLPEEKQPARQERIDEPKDAAAEATGAAKAANAEAKPAESNVQVIPATKNAAAAAADASAAEPEPKPVAAASTAELKSSSGAEINSAAGAAEAQTTAAKGIELPAEPTATAAEPKKIEEAPAGAEIKAGGEPTKTGIATEAEQAQLKQSEEQKPKTSSEEEKSGSEKKSTEESKDSSESKESDESNDSKEDKSN